MATLITTDGTTRDVKPDNGTDFSLDELYALIGCQMVEVVYLPDGRTLWFDEEGKIGAGGAKPYNEGATPFARLAGIADEDYIVGTALLCADGEVL